MEPCEKVLTFSQATLDKKLLTSYLMNLVSILEGFSSVWHSNIKEDKVGISHIPNTHDSIIKELAKNSVEFNKNNLNTIYSNFPKVINNHLPS